MKCYTNDHRNTLLRYAVIHDVAKSEKSFESLIILLSI
ncbi:hypothetical protein VHP8226_02393 [Vibrio hippocampi]|uniref:Uncharacterized protein n=1 Tax=Vibrio hippocampi TaxID=654686 RepID=A0ABN8DI03_9VIBR|nr:hypothetical protein VHP8226_02393 [Vibrio hippocampi]